jgi:hypothetical protein
MRKYHPIQILTGAQAALYKARHPIPTRLRGLCHESDRECFAIRLLHPRMGHRRWCWLEKNHSGSHVSYLHGDVALWDGDDSEFIDR